MTGSVYSVMQSHLCTQTARQLGRFERKSTDSDSTGWLSYSLETVKPARWNLLCQNAFAANPSGQMSFPVTAPGQQLHFIKIAGDSFYPVCLDASFSLGGVESKVEELSWPCLWGGLGVGVEPLNSRRGTCREVAY